MRTFRLGSGPEMVKDLKFRLTVVFVIGYFLVWGTITGQFKHQPEQKDERSLYSQLLRY